MDKLQIIMPYYNAPGMLHAHLFSWSMFPEDIRKRLKVILVDDGSQKPALDVIRSHWGDDPMLDLQLYRVLVDIPWNQHGARNLGAQVADEGWLFMTDIDHTLPLESVRWLLDQQKVNEHYFYTVRRMTAVRNGNGEVAFEPMLNKDDMPKPHPNTYLLTKAMFWAAGGYDEDFCGTYGGDGPFRRHLNQVSKHCLLSEPYIVRWPREIIPDASQPSEFREAYRPLYGPKFREKGGGAIKPPTDWVRFPWERQI